MRCITNSIIEAYTELFYFYRELFRYNNTKKFPIFMHSINNCIIILNITNSKKPPE